MTELFSPLLPLYRSVITITKSGYIKRMPVQEFEAQRRGGKGKAGAKMSTDQDAVAQFFSCNDHDTLLFITDRFVSMPA
jgi:DNA gyrase subunit A